MQTEIMIVFDVPYLSKWQLPLPLSETLVSFLTPIFLNLSSPNCHRILSFLCLKSQICLFPPHYHHPNGKHDPIFEF